MRQGPVLSSLSLVFKVMITKRKWKACAGIIIVIFTGIRMTSPHKNDLYKNLKVLSKKTNPKQMDSLMYGFSKALGVGCGFCHVRARESDEKPEKNIARQMMKMNTKINKKYFEDGAEITCFTCHREKPHP